MYDDTRSDDLEERFRAAAVNSVGATSPPVDSAAVWLRLVNGQAVIVDEFATAGWLYLIIRSCGSRGLRARPLEILEQVLLGTEPKVVSIERRLSPSTVACSLKQAFETIGLRCKPSKVPLLLVTLVHAAKGRGELQHYRSGKFEHEEMTYEVLCMPSTNQVFERVLPPAEQCVLRLFLEGKSHAEIAARRQTSLRTVANQMASAFHRLGISGRSHLIKLLIARTAAPSLDDSCSRPLVQRTQHLRRPANRAQGGVKQAAHA